MKVKKSKSNDWKDVLAAVAYKAVPRPGLIILAAALIIIPLFGKAANRLEPAGDSVVSVGNSSLMKETRVGKWGELTLVPIVISPPMELVSTDWGETNHPTWFFPDADAEKAFRMLLSAGVSVVDAARLRAKAQAVPEIKGVVLTPNPDWVRTLTTEIRARIYATLAKCELNQAQALAFRFPVTSPETWLHPDLISQRTRQLIEPLIFRNGNYMLFSDIQLVREEIGNADELRRLSKTLFRQPTVIAHLSVGPKADLDKLIHYWGRGGRDIKIRPLIESAAGSGTNESIDVIHLLPPFAKERLYCYPTFSDADLNKPSLVNCLWTSLNFFLPEPDDRFLDAAVALKTLQEDYFIIETDFKLGDILAFVDGKGNIFHAAVYVAGDLVFSKNGISSMAPWTLMSIDEVKEYYQWQSENPRIIVHRRKDL
ncbi:MAG: hypothetical protein JXR49_11290 [Acidobacteria bacterium]|nr:hypothetical protein [Acidobacteriota bacterium]